MCVIYDNKNHLNYSYFVFVPMTKTILLATVVAVTILGLTSASVVFNTTAEADHGGPVLRCIEKLTVYDPNSGLCVRPENCPNGLNDVPDGEPLPIIRHCALITDERTPVRDNVDVENIKLKQGQFRVIVDNAGIGATSDVEITWNFKEKDCVVIAAGTVGGSFGTVGLVDDGAFSVGAGVPVGHNDVKFVEAVLLGVATDAKHCKIDSNKGEFVAVSTVAMGPVGELDTSNPTGP